MGLFNFNKKQKDTVVADKADSSFCSRCGVATHKGFSAPSNDGKDGRLYFCNSCCIKYQEEEYAKALAYLQESKKTVNEQKRTIEQLYEEALKDPNPYLLKDIEYPPEYPTFKFFPNPLRTPSVIESSAPCECCGKVNKYSYVAGMDCPIEDEIIEISNLCLHCIANGEAVKKFGGAFIDRSCIANRTADKAVTEEIMYRTPSFTTWQEKEWLSHCKFPCIYIGQVYIADLLKMGIYKQVRTELSKTFYYKQMPMTIAEIDDMLIQMTQDSSLEGHLFKCTICGKYKLHTDLD